MIESVSDGYAFTGIGLGRLKILVVCDPGSRLSLKSILELLLWSLGRFVWLGRIRSQLEFKHSHFTFVYRNRQSVVPSP